jgi:acyl carrier protein
MTEAQVYEGLTEIFRDLFADDSIVVTEQLGAGDIAGWDSAAHLNLILATENRFGVRMRTTEIESMKTVGDLVRLVLVKARGKLSAQASTS